jgi:hypothetical protein
MATGNAIQNYRLNSYQLGLFERKYDSQDTHI